MLAENVRHHIEEEEGDAPEATKVGKDLLAELGEQMARKKEAEKEVAADQQMS